MKIKKIFTLYLNSYYIKTKRWIFYSCNVIKFQYLKNALITKRKCNLSANKHLFVFLSLRHFRTDWGLKRSDNKMSMGWCWLYKLNFHNLFVLSEISQQPLYCFVQNYVQMIKYKYFFQIFSKCTTLWFKVCSVQTAVNCLYQHQ